MLQRGQPAAVVCKACLQRCSVQRASAGARLQGALQPKTNLLLGRTDHASLTTGVTCKLALALGCSADC